MWEMAMFGDCGICREGEDWRMAREGEAGMAKDDDRWVRRDDGV